MSRTYNVMLLPAHPPSFFGRVLRFGVVGAASRSDACASLPARPLEDAA
ncbi:hypothetical protein [Sinomonas notoginsengisoli]|nr:hypothetical protein [Sinomonas notoginsengisoli]